MALWRPGTGGQCKAATASKSESLCQVPAKVWEIQWENPAVSGKKYEIMQARVGEYMEWKWDDVFHDVWLMEDSNAAAACDFTRATELINAVHHSFDAVGGRAIYELPESATDGVLYFACGVKTHCQNGQIMRTALRGGALHLSTPYCHSL